jgi:hypothetical protein
MVCFVSITGLFRRHNKGPAGILIKFWIIAGDSGFITSLFQS